MAERSKAPDSRLPYSLIAREHSGPRLRAWVQIPLLTNIFWCRQLQILNFIFSVILSINNLVFNCFCKGLIFNLLLIWFRNYFLQLYNFIWLYFQHFIKVHIEILELLYFRSAATGQTSFRSVDPEPVSSSVQYPVCFIPKFPVSANPNIRREALGTFRDASALGSCRILSAGKLEHEQR
jgi:hypothetical protein